MIIIAVKPLLNGFQKESIESLYHTGAYKKNAYFLGGFVIQKIEKTSGLQEGWYIVEHLFSITLVRGDHMASSQPFVEYNEKLDQPGWYSLAPHEDGSGVLN